MYVQLDTLPMLWLFSICIDWREVEWRIAMSWSDPLRVVNFQVTPPRPNHGSLLKKR